jgi:hypothetical protein
MIDKIANNETNKEELNLHPTKDIVEKLNYYRSFFGKVQDLSDDEFENLKKDIAKFFNLKIGGNTQEPPQRLVRISNNNRILSAQGKVLSYLTDISQLLAPPIQFCGFGRCNTPNQQVLYCATSEAGAYWEIKPKHGDVITLSHYELKPNGKVNSLVIMKDKTLNPKIQNQLQEVYYHLEDFFVDAYSLEVDRSRPRDYLFSALLSSEQLFYPIVSDKNFEALIYPSVQRKKFGENFAIRNEIILERYNLIGVETRFILDEYENIDPASDEITTDQIIGSFFTTEFDFKTGKILYNEKADEIFNLFRMMQTGQNKQVRYEHEGVSKNIPFNLSPKKANKVQIKSSTRSKIGRNERINVVYQNGTRKDNVKFKSVQYDIENGKCKITNY